MATTVPVFYFVGGKAVQIGTTDLTGDDEARYLAPDRVRISYQTLRQWSLDAAQANTDWPTMTAVQKDNALRETVRRLGVFLDRFADVLVLDNRTP